MIYFILFLFHLNTCITEFNLFINLLFIWLILLYLLQFILLRIEFNLWLLFVLISSIATLYVYMHSLRLLIWDVNVRNIRISNTAHLMSSTFSERFRHFLFWTYFEFYVRSKIKWRTIVLVSKSIHRSWFCVYLRLRAVIQCEISPSKVTAVDLIFDFCVYMVKLNPQM